MECDVHQVLYGLVAAFGLIKLSISCKKRCINVTLQEHVSLQIHLVRLYEELLVFVCRTEASKEISIAALASIISEL